ncbi:hypothetical protein [Caldovatus aquaticus]|uniref:Uncharacterized protein n=1 Tax=Caldovatus aquaticus TaxID=2865671 RepID=A0ABS7EZF9_9PROT|nr:hypothetical protein [Caldovatus aquaticus]MBW8268736.1 hypothetical protein [Caldovatus aquaticus]
MRTATDTLRTAFALGLVAAGLLLDLFLVVLILGEGFAPARLSTGAAAAAAVLGGLMLLTGLFLIEPRRPGDAATGRRAERPMLASR